MAGLTCSCLPWLYACYRPSKTPNTQYLSLPPNKSCKDWKHCTKRRSFIVISSWTISGYEAGSHLVYSSSISTVPSSQIRTTRQSNINEARQAPGIVQPLRWKKAIMMRKLISGLAVSQLLRCCFTIPSPRLGRIFLPLLIFPSKSGTEATACRRCYYQRDLRTRQNTKWGAKTLLDSEAQFNRVCTVLPGLREAREDSLADLIKQMLQCDPRKRWGATKVCISY